MVDDTCESKLYVGNLDQRITEANVIKMFSPFGKIISEDFLWHTRGPKKGEPRGYAFIQYGSKEEAQLAKTEMNGKLAYGRPLVVRYADEKYHSDTKDLPKTAFNLKKSCFASGSGTCQTSRSAKIAAIKNKLKTLEQEGCSSKKLKTESFYVGRGDVKEED
ncbi:probable RNA-binding protein 18 [Phalaenopsis equestris]|uniref:probable RNA-binding protein 18 n=1 Tax=Phalaenopsis equestris TaxID=78828 RepID=UPI0009E565DD|nr:probable RNA-binding protein 18 [Phalaenopsis equestris]XP_020585710.1 probable RNA-binding protein 18 [Phalaenopsis equestris]